MAGEMNRPSGLLQALFASCLGFAAALGAAVSGAAEATCPTSTLEERSGFGPAWREFRAHLMAGQTEKVAAVVRFPLLRSGIVDSEKTRRIGHADFNAFLRDFLASDSGQKAAFSTVRQFVIEHPCAVAGAVNESGDGAQIGPMVFIKEQGQWRWTRVFSHTD
jgi:hypothetical protein